MYFRAGRAPPFRRRPTAHDGSSVRIHAWPRTFWFKPVSTFGLSGMTTFIRGSHVLAVPILPSPVPPWCWQSLLCLTARHTDKISRYIVPGASHGAVAGSACPGRERLVEQPVSSGHSASRETEIHAIFRSHCRNAIDCLFWTGASRRHAGLPCSWSKAARQSVWHRQWCPREETSLFRPDGR